MKSSLKLVAVGAMVAAGLMFGSGTAHALNNDPTAALCAQIAQSAANEGHTMAVEMAEYGVSGCLGGPAGPSAALCAAIALQAPNEGHTFAQEAAEWGVVGCPDPGTPAPVGGPGAALCASIQLQAPNEGHSFYDEMVEWGVTGCPGADTLAGRTAVLGASAGPRAAAPVAAQLSQTVLAASAAPQATASRLPVTGGDIAGLLTVALAGLALGGGLLLVDKRRRSNAA